MSKRKFRASDGEEFEVIDERRKRKPKPASRRRVLTGATVALVVALLAFLLVLTTRQTEEPSVPVSPTAEPVIVTATAHPGPCPDILAAPEGRIALIARLPGSDEDALYLMDTAGRNLCQMAAEAEGIPRWSPDGEHLTFTRRAPSTPANENRHEIAMMNIRNGETVTVTPGSINALNATWSPSGNQIAFQIWDGSRQNIATINTDSSGLRALTDENGYNELPAWSPDGQQIAYISNRNATTTKRNAAYDIYVMSADGTGIHQLTRNALFDYAPAWSPDGSMIAFSSQPDSNPQNAREDIFIMDANCDQLPVGCEGNMRNLTHNGHHNLYPLWLPDGQHIACLSSERDGDRGIYVIDVQTGDTRRITRPPVQVNAFDWWSQ